MRPAQLISYVTEKPATARKWAAIGENARSWVPKYSNSVRPTTSLGFNPMFARAEPTDEVNRSSRSVLHITAGICSTSIRMRLSLSRSMLSELRSTSRSETSCAMIIS